jgi:hypothetical protein
MRWFSWGVRGPPVTFTSSPVEDGTLMRDLFEYAAPLGPLGRLADWLFLERHMRRLLHQNNRYLKWAAEADEAADGDDRAPG